MNLNLDPQQLADFVRHSPFFDAQWYEQEYPEIEYHAEGNPDAAYHYANYGYKEQRLPSVLFDGNKYSKYHQLQDVNPLVHYVQSGASGNYLVKERQQEVLTKASLGLPLTKSERVLWLEVSYAEHFNGFLNLAGRAAASFSDKIYFLRAYHNPEMQDELKDKTAKLLDSTKLNEVLPPLGVNAARVAAPLFTFKSVADIDFNQLPQVFRVRVNGLSHYDVPVINKTKVKNQVLLGHIEAMQLNAKAALKADPLSSLFTQEPSILVYGQDQLLENAVTAHEAAANAAKNASDLKEKEGANSSAAIAAAQEVARAATASALVPQHLEVICFNGKAMFVAHHQQANGFMTLFDRDFKLLPTVITTDNRSNHQISGQMQKPECFDEICAEAERIAQGYKLMCVNVSCLGNAFVINDIRLSPVNGNFALTNDYNLKLGALLDLGDLHAY